MATSISIRGAAYRHDPQNPVKIQIVKAIIRRFAILKLIPFPAKRHESSQL